MLRAFICVTRLNALPFIEKEVYNILHIITTWQNQNSICNLIRFVSILLTKQIKIVVLT